MSESSSTTLKPKNIDEMLAALKKAAKSKGFDIKGDKHSGKSNPVEGATVAYVVNGQEVTVDLTRFRGRLQAEVFSHFGVNGSRVVHRRRGACHAGADGGQPVFGAQD
jgi:hypothetical protein